MSAVALAWTERAIGLLAVVAVILGDVYAVDWSPLTVATLGALVGVAVPRPSALVAAPEKSP